MLLSPSIFHEQQYACLHDGPVVRSLHLEDGYDGKLEVPDLKDMPWYLFFFSTPCRNLLTHLVRASFFFSRLYRIFLNNIFDVDVLNAFIFRFNLAYWRNYIAGGKDLRPEVLIFFHYM